MWNKGERNIKRAKCKCWIGNWFLFDCVSYKKKEINKRKVKEKDELKKFNTKD